ncbi:MAG: hypothetical protein IT477_02200, partial [Rhodanobacteraceae bacterium]|nr:hypothetical protein [Rhodanobacteraceae bacterium]
ARGSGGGDGGRGTPSLTASAWLRHPATWALGAVALLLAGFAGGQYYASDGLSRAEMAEVVRETLLAHEVSRAAAERLAARLGLAGP